MTTLQDNKDTDMNEQDDNNEFDYDWVYVYVHKKDDDTYGIGQTEAINFLTSLANEGKLCLVTQTYSVNAARNLVKKLDELNENNSVLLDELVRDFEFLLDTLRPEVDNDEEKEGTFDKYAGLNMSKLFHHVPVAMGRVLPTCGWDDWTDMNEEIFGTYDWLALFERKREYDEAGDGYYRYPPCPKCLELSPI